MPADPGHPDDDLLVLARTGDREAASALVERHLDAVYDHLSRWTRDSALAAAATIGAVSALFGPSEPLPVTGLRAWLLRTGREHAVAQLRDGGGDDTEVSRLSPAVLAATGPRATSADHTTAITVWAAAAALDDHRFTVLDLATRQELDDTRIAAVTGDAVEDVVEARERIDRGLSGSAPDPLAVYAGLAPFAAPVSVRSAVADVVAERVAPVPTGWPTRVRQLAIGAIVVGGVLAVVSVASALRADPAAIEPPPSVVAEALETPSPSASPSPSPTPTLEPLESPAPTATPEPTSDPSPSASPEPTPVTVTLDSPVGNAEVAADDVDEIGREVGVLTVAATATGPDGFLVRWSTDLDPDVSLLDAEDGSVALWLADACTDTAHPLRVTVTDLATGESDSAVIEVVARHTCAAPLQEVRIDAPIDGATVAISGVDVNAVATPTSTTDDGITWTWTSDKLGGEVLLDRASGTIRLVNSTCEPVTHVLTVDAVRDSDGSGGRASVTVFVEPVADCVSP